MGKQKTATLKEKKPRDYVAETEIMTQCINKENKYLKITDNYVCNPNTIVVVPDKPLVERPKPQNQGENSETGQSDSMSEFKETLKLNLRNHYGVPSQKFKYPQTTSQEIGWYQNYVRL